ncbi:CoA transferase [Streptacidiphilus sp. PAMC 29251]
MDGRPHRPGGAEARPGDRGVAWADVRDSGTVLDSPTAVARQIAVEVDDGVGGARRVVRTPYRFSAADSGPRGGAPLTGEHTVEVLDRWLGQVVDKQMV